MIDQFNRRVYRRPIPQNFIIVVEAKRGPNNIDPGKSVYEPGGRPDLQIQADKPLGNGSVAVCDDRLPELGGIPAVTPTSYDPADDTISDVLNDFGCRFRVHVRPTDGPCTLDADGNEAYASSQSRVQYCYEPAVGGEAAFLHPQTLLTVRVRDTQGGLGDPVQILVIIGP